MYPSMYKMWGIILITYSISCKSVSRFWLSSSKTIIMYFQDILAILVSADGTDSSDEQICQVRLALMQVPSTDEVLPCLLQTFKMQKFSKKKLNVPSHCLII